MEDEKNTGKGCNEGLIAISEPGGVESSAFHIFLDRNPGWNVKPAGVPPFLHYPMLPLPLDGETAGKG